MGTKANPGEFDGYGRALPDEPMFTLLARDPRAASLVDAWAKWCVDAINEGERPDIDVAKADDARRIAQAMRDWREANEGAWQTPDKAE